MPTTGRPRLAVARARTRHRYALTATTIVTALLIPALALAARHRHRAQATQWSCAGASRPATKTTTAAARAALLCLINQQRTSRGLPALRHGGRLDASAQRWTNQMVASNDFAHVRGGSTPGSRATAAGFSWSVLGENIATGFATPKQVVTAWMASPDHCRNILDPYYTYAGAGVNRQPVPAAANTPATWTIDFGLPAGAHPRSRNWGPADAC
jgi:uncharacterized protein YkwD